MKILFIENRYKTKLWEIIGEELEAKGHEVHWIVQNHLFKPSFGTIKTLPYPKKIKKEKQYTPGIKKIIQADRGLNYFEIKSDDFIFWYEDQVEKVLDTINPDLVFGESTLFHELLVIKACKERKILYLHPSSSRYPANRFSFYKYDTLVPYGSSKDTLNLEEAKQTSNAIGKRSVLPDYMNISKTKLNKFQWLKDKTRLTLAYYLGERYNTPSPFIKQRVNAHYSENIKAWEKLAVSVSAFKEEFYILYPLQMQPEANIDVWGFPNNNQAGVIQRILNDLEEGDKLVIKPNPKSKYEITSELLAIISQNPGKIVVLNHASKMSDLWDYINMVVTVTGTISIECIFDNKPIVMLGPGIQNTQKNCRVLKSTESLKSIILQVKNGLFPQITEEEKVAFLQELMKTSFKGVNGDGLHNKSYLNDKNNINGLKSAYLQIIHQTNYEVSNRN